MHTRNPLRRIVHAVAALATAAVLAGCGSADTVVGQPAPAETASASPKRGPAPGLSPTIPTEPSIDRLDEPFVIAHRGGAAVHPEHSAEAFAAAAGDGFVLEPDVQALADGTLVVVHDETTERTMTGPVVDVADMTLADWQSRDVLPAPGTTTHGTPVTFTEFLDAHAGDAVLIPEVKDDTAAVVRAVVDELDQRGLQDSTIVQLGSLTHTGIPTGAGFQTLVLTNRATLLDPADITAAGAEWVGVSASTSPDYIADCTAAGLRTLVYTVNDVPTYETAVSAGAAGAFSDDPWLLAGVEP